MKTFSKILSAIALAACLSHTQANAADLTLLNHTGIATIDDQGADTVRNWLVTQITAGMPNPGPAHDATKGYDVKKATIDVTGYKYLVLHWGGNPTGTKTSYEQAYYIANDLA
jgi:hypothetical protein